jgi:hypothetical protein
MNGRRDLASGLVDNRLRETDYLAGNAFIAAGIVTVDPSPPIFAPHTRHRHSSMARSTLS